MSSIAINPGFTRTARPARSTRVASTAPVRLTRRGRVIAVLLLLGLVLAAFTAFGSRSAATGEAGVPVQTQTVEVGAGDTLWEIADDVAAPGETRSMVHRIQELNALTGAGVIVGQEIAVPVG